MKESEQPIHSIPPPEAHDAMTPKEAVAALDRYVVGQHSAKRAVAIALRNRHRRRQVAADLKEEIAPKNIIMIGPTGVGKTEIARRLARMTRAPFVKVEASKYTEVGYVGRDVDSMIRDLVEAGVRIVKEEERLRVLDLAQSIAENSLLALLFPSPTKPAYESAQTPEALAQMNETKEKLRTMLRAGTLDERMVEIEINEAATAPNPQAFFGSLGGMEEMGNQLQEMLAGMQGSKRGKKREVSVKEAREILKNQEANQLINMDKVTEEAIKRTQESGIVFIDEIDKIASSEGSSRGPDISRQGVQRDLLPLVEGSQVNTKHGIVKTDHILFIAAGAFHVSKVSDLIPELQGRFPIRVELEALTEEDFVRILTEPTNSLVRQYTALLATEEVTLEFSEEGIRAICRIAAEANRRAQNIGARRLHTVMEKLLEEISFEAPDKRGTTLKIDAALVEERLGELVKDEDLARYIL